MKRIPTKKEIRDQLNREVEAFLAEGGEIRRVDRGESGLTVNAPLKPNALFSLSETSTTRTYLPEVVAAIDARRKQKKTPAKNRLSRKPRKKVIYDDFGEPIRWEWQE